MKDKYEISLWEDFPNTIEKDGEEISFLDERKICVIGSDTMTSLTRAIEPKFVENVNGTHTLTFKMMRIYYDEITGEKKPNPFLSLLINERKVKVLWKNNWYDLLIKNIDEDRTGNNMTYTCEDVFITELSKNGYNLEFNTDLQNNIGTAQELIESVLDGSGWSFDEENSDKMYAAGEEAVYEIKTNHAFQAINEDRKKENGQDISIEIDANSKILVFYSSVMNLNEDKNNVEVQFLYSEDNEYITEDNEMLVINGIHCKANFDVKVNSGIIDFKIDNVICFTVILQDGVSTKYRAERLINTQKTKYEQVLNRYVNIYEDPNDSNKEIYGYDTLEFYDPLIITNLVVNPSNFINSEGWKKMNGAVESSEPVRWELYPSLPSSGIISDSSYNPKSYLVLPSNSVIKNYSLQSNIQYLKPTNKELKEGVVGGFHKGDKYVARIKAYSGTGAAPSTSSLCPSNSIIPSIGKYDNNNTFHAYFAIDNSTVLAIDGYNQFILNCIENCSLEEIKDIDLFFTTNQIVWVKEAQFFKYMIAPALNSDNEIMMKPGTINTKGVSKNIYRYYNYKNNESAKEVEDLNFLYEGEEKQNYSSVLMNYEKMATIQEKNSNRFNILQSIAETFQGWVRFNIEHNSDTGKMLYNNDGLPIKKVSFVRKIGRDLGWSFEYGIDLKDIKRKIKSNDICSKLIVIPNSNEFAINGFCSIARSKLNYTKTNAIYNFDYYIMQGLLDQENLNEDLYGYPNGYFYQLRQKNNSYDKFNEKISRKEMNLLKQSSQLTVTEQQIRATEQKINDNKVAVEKLSGTSYTNSEAYLDTHGNNTKVKNLVYTIKQLTIQLNEQNAYKTSLTISIGALKDELEDLYEASQDLINDIKEIDTKFFSKYSRFIQEGTWQDENYVDDDSYYLDAVDVAYTSSRPRLEYDLNVMRLTSLEDFSSKVFGVGDSCYVIDREFFGYSKDGITPYKLKILIHEITSYFDSPEKDTIKIANYKTQFDELFERIVATTQSVQYASGDYNRAANMIKPNKILDYNLLQDTFDYNENLILNANNQQVIWDGTGITVTDDKNAALKVRIIAGGIFISNDGGITWKNAVRGDGISTDVLTAGRINTSEIYVYSEDHPSFRWDSYGITAYTNDIISDQPYKYSKFVRFDQYGIYGYDGDKDFVPDSESDIWNDSKTRFALTWKGFLLQDKGEWENTSITISSEGKEVYVHRPIPGQPDRWEMIRAAIYVERNDKPTFYVTKDGDAYFKGSLEACGRIYCTEDSDHGYYRNDSSYMEVNSDGFALKVKQPNDDNYATKAIIGYSWASINGILYAEPYLHLGEGGAGSTGAIIKKEIQGLTIKGNSSVTGGIMINHYNEVFIGPDSQRISLNDMSSTIAGLDTRVTNLENGIKGISGNIITINDSINAGNASIGKLWDAVFNSTNS